MNFAQKMKLVLSDRKMQAAYARWHLAKLTTGKPPIRNVGADVGIGSWINFSEYWGFRDLVPKPERVFMNRCLEAGKQNQLIAFDIGANIGGFTCVLAAMGAAQVHAFEPIPETFCRLKENVLANNLFDRCILNCLAVGNQTEIVTFQVEANSPATNKFAPTGGEISNRLVRSRQHIAATSLDTYCFSFGVDHIDFLKVDVEGMEPWVLGGAQRMFAERRIKAVLIEICPNNLRAVGLSPADLYREFRTARYSPYSLNNDGKSGAKLSLAEIEAMVLANIVLLPDA